VCGGVLQLDESENLLENLEDALIQADFGPGSSLKIVDEVRTRVEAGELTTSEDIKTALKQAIANLLESKGGGGKSDLQLTDDKPNVIMVVRSPSPALKREPFDHTGAGASKAYMMMLSWQTP
jgi:signal recognition particle GTPase